MRLFFRKQFSKHLGYSSPALAYSSRCAPGYSAHPIVIGSCWVAGQIRRFGVAKRIIYYAFKIYMGLPALFFVPKPDRSEHGVQRSKAESRDKRYYKTQVLLSKLKKN